MSKLFKLKNWLTIDEAAKHLSGAFTELVTELDVLRLALDGRLKLSVNFVNPVVVKLGTLMAKEDIPYEEVVGKNGKKFRHYISMQHVTEDGRIYVYHAKDPAYTLRGVCDVPMDEGFRLEIERRYQRISGGPKLTGSRVNEVLVEVVEMDLCQFEMCTDEPDFPDAGDCAKLIIESMAASPLSTEQQIEVIKRGLEVIRRTSEYCIVDQLPEELLLVVRRNSLTDFISSVSDAPAKLEKPLENRERHTLLTIIAVLAKAAKVPLDDCSKLGKAAGYIEGLTDEFGAHVSKRAIEEHLKKIPDALTTRMK